MFNDPIAENRFSQLKRQFGFDVFIETGTHHGHGAINAAKYCPMVYTCEINEDHQSKAISEWVKSGFTVVEDNGVVMCKNGFTIIHSELKSSPMFLNSILPYLNEPVCFYLDAHWGEYWPLLDELKEISEWGRRDKCVIIIHDFKVPGKPWGYDNHGGRDLDLDYVRSSLNKINPGFKLLYNDDAAGNCRGILYATP